MDLLIIMIKKQQRFNQLLTERNNLKSSIKYAIENRTMTYSCIRSLEIKLKEVTDELKNIKIK